jgi:peptidoglycan/LPS O-acetylase OafA/YrhL
LTRLIRIWPVYVFVFLFYWNFFGFFIDGPLSGYLYNKESAACDVEWPFLVTFTSNFFYNTNSFGCLHYYWYLSNDIQYFIIGVILLFIYAKSKVGFIISFISLNSLTIGLEIWSILENEPGNNIMDFKTNNFNEYNTAIYAWSFPYFMGFLLGMAFSKYKKRLEKNKASKIEVWLDNVKDSTLLSLAYFIVGLGLMIFFTCITYDSYEDKWETAMTIINNVLFRKLISIGFFLLSIPLLLGNLYNLGGWIGATGFIYLSKLSYTAFLISPLVIRFAILNMKIGVVWQSFYIFILTVSITVISFTLSILISMLVEMPFNRMRQNIKRRLQLNRRPSIKSQDFLKPVSSL